MSVNIKLPLFFFFIENGYMGSHQVEITQVILTIPNLQGFELFLIVLI